MKRHLSLLLAVGLAYSGALYGASIAQVISSPGKYQPGNTFISDPTDENDATFIIQSDDVELDLQSCLLTQDPTNQIGGFVGVRIQPNYKNISITSGRIEDLTGSAIEVLSGCEQIRIDGVTISGCHNGGILLTGTTGSIDSVEIENCSITTSTGVGGAPGRGIHAQFTESLSIHDNGLLRNDASLTSTGYGCLIESSTRVSLLRNTISENGGAYAGYGASLNNSKTIYIKDCFFNSNSARATDVVALAIGLELIGCSETEVFDCEMNNNESTSGSAWGLYSSRGIDNLVIDSIMQNNLGAVNVAGIEINNDINTDVRQNLIFGNEADTAYGIHLTGNCNHCSLTKNECKNNEGSSNSFGIIDDRNPSTNLFIQNLAFNHSTNYTVTYPSTILLPIVKGSLSDDEIGLPNNTGGLINNIDIDA